MIPILPESAPPPLSLVVFLANPPSNQLHGSRNSLLRFTVHSKEMNMVRGRYEVENLQAVALPGFKEPLYPSTTITPKLQQKLALVASVRDVPDAPRNMITIRSHGPLPLVVHYNNYPKTSDRATPS